jgi:PAS domain S-box-containing protein
MIDASPDALVRTDLEGRIVAFSRQHAEMLGINEDTELKGVSAFDFIVPEQREEAFTNMQRVLKEGVVRNLEYRALRSDGTPFDIGLSVSVIRDGEGWPTGFMGILRDITVEKENRRRIEALAAEQELLLHEVHHRVKNHMNTIRSMLSLQRSNSGDPAVDEALLAAENRIALMQNIYRRLYQSDQHNSIGLPDFMHQLLNDLKAALSIGIPVEMEMEVDDVVISAGQSLPLAIIVNELVTNAFKYAFDRRSEGIIGVWIRETSPGRLSIRVSDNGSGFPREVSEDHVFGFGLSVVEEYIHQYEGELIFFREETGRNGISATIVLAK